MSAVIEAVGLRRAFGGRVAVRGVDLTVAAGEVVGLLGPNGAGKSTTLRMLAGVLAASGGRAVVAGHDVFEAPVAAKARLGFLPERPPLHPELAVRDMVAYAAALRGVQDVPAAVARALPLAGLDAVADRRVGNLSKGFKQRVGVAMAVVHRPEALLLDEPTSGLDPAERVALREVVRRLAADGAAVLLSTHVLAEVEATTDRVVLLRAGAVVADRPMTGLGDGLDLLVRVGRSDGVGEALRAVPGVREVVAEGDAWRVRAEGDVRAAVARAAAPFDLLELTRPRGLEQLYLRLTGEVSA